MKVSRQVAAENRKAILDAAARLYRERGVMGAGVAEITREAGFTHGGFYGHFESKEALAAEACKLAYEASLRKLQERLRADDGDLGEHLRQYLSPQHRDEPGDGCPMPTLAVDASRGDSLLRAANAQGIARYLQALAGPDGRSPSATDKARAITTLAALVGGMVLARATVQDLPELSDEILGTLRRELGQL